jgi:rhodanese-related sulfurtransferase
VNGAINIPHREMTATRMAEYPKDKVFVVYCAGPHCNGVTPWPGSACR